MATGYCRECQEPLDDDAEYCYGCWSGIEIVRLREALERISQLPEPPACGWTLTPSDATRIARETLAVQLAVQSEQPRPGTRRER
jgi:hypothetical protein